MYNFFSLISSQAKLEDKWRKYVYKPNFSAVADFGRKYFLGKLKLFDVEKLIAKFILPIRKGRSNPCKFSPLKKESFMYR